MKKYFFLFYNLFICLPFFAGEINLGEIVTEIQPSSGEIIFSETRIKNYSSVQEVLESVGFSFKSENNEISFHGFWNSSVKIFINDILMNDPNTGKFDFSSLNLNIVKSIKIEPGVLGGVNIYISTYYENWEKPSLWLKTSSKSFCQSPLDSVIFSGGISNPIIFSDGSGLFVQNNFSFGQEKNNFGYRSKDGTYSPSLKESYSTDTKKYSGYGKKSSSNSFNLKYSDSTLPGSSFELFNFLSLGEKECGSTTGYYGTTKTEKDFFCFFSLPIFIPFEKFSFRFVPSWKYSNLEYTEISSFSSLQNSYKINNLSFTSCIAGYRFFKIDFSFSKDFALQKSLSEFYLAPCWNFNLAGFETKFSLPLTYFNLSNEFDFLFDLKITKRVGELSFFTEISRNTTHPVFQQLYYSGSGGKGNPDLKSEHSLAFYCGGNFFNRKKAGITIKPFLIFYRDKIGWSEKSGLWQCENINSSVNYGFDTFFSTGNFFSLFLLEGDYTLCRAILSSGENSGNQIMYTPVHSLNVRLTMPFTQNFRWHNEFRFTSKKFLDNSNKNSVPNSFLFNTGFLWNINKFEISASWNNVLDFQYCPVDGYPAGGANFCITLKLNAL